MNSRRSVVGKPPGEVRVIAGHLRGSKLPVIDVPGLRPTSDRVRETLFNWLQNEIAGQQVLDLFAGTGALGFEAASRGAMAVHLLERDARVADSLRSTAERLKTAALTVETADALAWLSRPASKQFSVVFIDPPFAAELWQSVATALAPWLAEKAWIYLETPLTTAFVPPAGWRVHRQGQTRDVCYTLFRLEAAVL